MSLAQPFNAILLKTGSGSWGAEVSKMHICSIPAVSSVAEYQTGLSYVETSCREQGVLLGHRVGPKRRGLSTSSRHRGLNC